MENFDFTAIYNRIRGSLVATHECRKHNPVLIFSAGCVLGGVFGPFLLPFSLGAVAATVVHHEFEMKQQNVDKEKEN
jgi:hypothetical protein